MSSRVFAACAAAVLALSASVAAVEAQSPARSTSPGAGETQGWPQRAVKLILPIGPGSGADIGARLFADRLSKAWGQPVVVENRPGGDSMIAIGAFIAANDDYTFFWGPSSSFVAHPYLHATLSYDPKDIVPLVRISNTIVSVVTPATLSIASMAEFVALAKAEPGKHNWAAVTGVNDFLFSSFVKSTPLDISRVPYRDGVQALNDVSEGRIQIYSAAFAITRPQVQAGKVRVIAITNSVRAPMLPDVPTAREAGFPAIEFDGLVGLYGRPSTSPALREKLAADMKAVLGDAEVVDRLTVTGQVVNFGASAEFIRSVDQQRAVAAAAARVLGIKASQ